MAIGLPYAEEAGVTSGRNFSVVTAILDYLLAYPLWIKTTTLAAGFIAQRGLCVTTCFLGSCNKVERRNGLPAPW